MLDPLLVICVTTPVYFSVAMPKPTKKHPRAELEAEYICLVAPLFKRRHVLYLICSESIAAHAGPQSDNPLTFKLEL